MIAILIGNFACDAFAAAVDQASAVFSELYAARIEKVRKTRSTADDLELAGELNSAMKKATGTPALLALMGDSAYDMAYRHRGGYTVAIESMRTLLAHAPDRRVEILGKIAAAQHNRFLRSTANTRTDAGNAWIDALLELSGAQSSIERRIKTVRQALLVAKKIKSDRRTRVEAALGRLSARTRAERMEKEYRANPGDMAVLRKLLLVFVVELDEPMLAKPYYERSDDPVLKKHLSLATQSVESLSEKDCLILGDWYEQLSHDLRSKPAQRRAMQKRALAYYRRFLTTHLQRDLQHTKTALAVRQIESELKVKSSTSPRDEPRREKPAHPMPSRGLVLHYSFESVSPTNTTVTDHSGGEHHGSVHGAVSTAGPVGRALKFDGRDDYVLFPKVADVTAITYAAWFRPASSRERVGIVMNHAYPAGAIHFQVWQHSFCVGLCGMGSVKATTTIGHFDLRKWRHYAATFDSGTKTVRLYVNGKLDTKRKFQKDRRNFSVGPGRIGDWDKLDSKWLGNRQLHGAIDEVRIYERVLSSDEIAVLAGQALAK